MAVVYLLYSPSLNKNYTGSCDKFPERLEQHKTGVFKKSFPSAANGWLVYFTIDGLE
jgi:predicted GIY-YIG superfamily endonuclease